MSKSIAILLLLSQGTMAQVERLACRVPAEPGETAEVCGTAWLVARGPELDYWVTAAHCVEDASRIAVAGQPAKVLQVNPVDDLAVLVAPRHGEIRPLPVCTRPDIVDVDLCGYGPMGKFRAWRGRIKGCTTAIEGQPCRWHIISGEARKGDSGGPVRSRNGCVVGVISAAGRGETIAVNTQPLVKILASCGIRPKNTAAPP